MYHKTRSYKTGEAVEWSYNIFHILNSEENQAKLQNLRDAFNPSKHYIIYTQLACYPEEDFFTKKGHISARTHDVSNTEKPLIDLITLKKYFNLEPPAGCKNLNTDDKFICDLISKKRPSKDGLHKIIISIELGDITSLDPI